VDCCDGVGWRRLEPFVPDAEPRQEAVSLALNRMGMSERNGDRSVQQQIERACGLERGEAGSWVRRDANFLKTLFRADYVDEAGERGRVASATHLERSLIRQCQLRQ